MNSACCTTTQWSIDRTAQPTIEPVTLATAKLFCEYDRNDKDVLFEDYWIPAAREAIETRIGRSLIERRRILYLDGFHGAKSIMLPCPPLAPAGTPPEITYYDTNGDQQTWSTSEWSAVDCGPNALSYIEPKYGYTWPSVRVQPQSVAITFLSGYQDNPLDPETTTGNMVPAKIKVALMLLVYKDLRALDGEVIDVEKNVSSKLPPRIDALGYDPLVWEC